MNPTPPKLNTPGYTPPQPLNPAHPHPDAIPEKSCGAIIVHDGKVLLVSQQNGLTGFPKGHTESGETEVATALREVKEETGLNIVIDPSTRHSFSYYIARLNVEKEVVLFLARLTDPSAIIHKQDSEIAQTTWVPLTDVEAQLNFPEWRKAWHTISQLIS